MSAAPAPRQVPGRGPRPRHPVMSVVIAALVVYFLFPLWWLVVASTKSNSGLFTGNPMWFGELHLAENLAQLGTYSGGIFWRWMGNSLFYGIVGGAGATALALAAGYGFAKFRFRGNSAMFDAVVGAIMIPNTALVIPLFVLFSAVGLVNTRWAVIIPSLLTVFGVYLMKIAAEDTIPDELLDAARIDGAGELTIFWRIAVPMLRPSIVTVFLLSAVGCWNNFFLPLVMLRSQDLLPITVGLTNWQAHSNAGAGNEQVWNLIASGALVSVLPLVVLFIWLQRYWQSGVALGSDR